MSQKHFSSRGASPAAGLLKLLRPTHWIKNSFVLAPLFFSISVLDKNMLIRALLACLAFCLASSCVYAFNDILDVHDDRHNPQKRLRPLATGLFSARAAAIAAGCCAIGAAGVAVFLPARVGILMAAYLALNVLYSLLLRRVVLLDVMALIAGFMLRIYAGAGAIGVKVSPWMALVTFFLSLFLGSAKRRQELIHVKTRQQRSVLANYSEGFLDAVMIIAASLTIVTYSLYVFQPSVVTRLKTESLIYTVPLVVFGLMRYLFLVVKLKNNRDVAELVLHDAPLLITIFLWITAVGLMLVFHA